MNKLVVEKLEAAIILNPANFCALHLLFLSCSNCHIYLIKHKINESSNEFYKLKLFNNSFELYDHPQASTSGRYDIVRSESCYELARIFHSCHAALQYSKQAYEHCLRTPEHINLSDCKALYLETRAAFAELPPLRFAVGDEVEFLHELETGSESEWRQGKIVELYYRERDFDISFSAPYRLQLIEGYEGNTHPVYAWVMADLDRYVRKVGVRSIEETRYQARLDAKVEELAQVYCSMHYKAL